MIEYVLQTVPEPRIATLRQQRELLDRTVEKLYVFPKVHKGWDECTIRLAWVAT